MTKQDFELIEGGIKEAEKDDTPFLVASDDTLAVVGDANKTQLNKHDFEIVFRTPPEEPGGSYNNVKKKFENVYITPRKETRVLRLITSMMPYFKGVTPEGEVRDLEADEKIMILQSVADEAFDHMYDLVAFVLGIDEELKEYMTPVSVMKAALQIIEGYPEVINEADTFFE